jgi:hypothetical protein
VEIDIGSLLSYKQEWILHRAFSAFPSPWKVSIYV